MTSRATNFRTVAMTSSRTSGSVAMRVGTVAEQLDDVVVGGLREVGVVHADGLEPVWRLEPHHLVGHRGQVTHGLGWRDRNREHHALRTLRARHFERSARRTTG